MTLPSFSIMIALLALASYQAIPASAYNTGFAVQELNSTGDCFISELVNYKASSLVNSSQKWSVCADVYLLGGYNVLGSYDQDAAGQSFSRSFSGLLKHNMMYFSFTYWRVDSWDLSDSFDMVFDSKTVKMLNMEFESYSFRQDYCGLTKYIDMPDFRIFGRIVHSSSSLLLKFIMRTNEGTNNESAGFRDIRLLFASTSTSTSMTETMCALAPTPLPEKQCSCTEGNYLARTGSCLSCHSLCTSCFGASAAECYQCATGASWDGTSCVQCNTSCTVCYGSAADQCVECTSGYVLYNGKYCVSATEITSPLSLSTDVCNKKTSTGTCDPGEFIYWDNSCSDSCDPPLSSSSISLPYMKCSYSCSTTDYLYWNKTCASNCIFPLRKNVLKKRNLCIYPCSSDQYLNWNGLCPTSCVYPKKIRVEADKNYCDLPCVITEFFYPNRSCFSSCPFPMRVVVADGAQMCIEPCDDATPFYYSEDQNCLSTCDSPYKPVDMIYYTGCEMQISAGDKKAVQGLASVANNAANVSSATTMATSVLSVSDPGGASASMLAKLLHYTKFVTVKRNARHELMLKSSKLRSGFLAFAPKISNSIRAKFKSQLLPMEFMKYKVHSSFIVNFWDGLMSLVICIGVLLFVWLFEVSTRSRENEYHINFLLKKVRMVAQNYLLLQYYNCQGDIVLFSVLDMSTVDFSTTPAVVSFNLGFLLTVSGIIFMCLHFVLLLRYQRTKKQLPPSGESQDDHVERFSKEYEGVKALFFSFKDASLVTQGYFLFLTLRNISCALIVSLLHKYPLVELTLMIVLSVAMFGYLLFARPFKEIVNLCQQVLGEIILLVVNGSLLGLFMIGEKYPNLTESQEKLNNLVIYCNMAVGFIAPTFLGIKLMIIAYQLINTRIESRKQQGQTMDSLEETMRKRMQKKNEVYELATKDQEFQFKQSSYSKIYPHHDQSNASTHLNIEQINRKSILKADSLRLPHLQPNQTSKFIMSSVIPSSRDMSSVQENIVQDHRTVKHLDQPLNNTPVVHYEQEFDASSANLKQDLSVVDIQDCSFDSRKTRVIRRQNI